MSKITSSGVPVEQLSDSDFIYHHSRHSLFSKVLWKVVAGVAFVIFFSSLI